MTARRSPATQPTNRRKALLAVAAATAAGLTASRITTRGLAAVGDPLLAGMVNNATPRRTTLRTDRNGTSLLLENRGGTDTSVALTAWVGEAASPTVQGDVAAIVAGATTAGTPFAFARGLHAKVAGGMAGSAAVYAEADAGAGVTGISQTGTGVSAQSPNGKALDVVGTSSFSGAATFASSVAVGGTLSVASLAGDGAGITNLNAANLATGLVPDLRLSPNVPLKGALANSFAGTLRALVFGGSGSNAVAFTSSGATILEKGKSQITVFNTTATRSTKIVATLQGNPGEGIFLSHIERGAGRFKVVLSGTATKTTTVAYFIFR